jgi:hypothetical protein
LPEEPAEVVAVADPLSVSNVPTPEAEGVTEPESVQVVAATMAVKFTFEMFAPLIVTVWLGGLNVYPVLLGVTVYVPFARLENV